MNPMCGNSPFPKSRRFYDGTLSVDIVSDVLSRALAVLFPTPSAEVLELSREFAKVSAEDLQVATSSYSNKRYAQSIYNLQQSVEKAAKGFGLLQGVVKPEELLREVGHKSLYAILLHSTDFSIALRSFAEDIRKEIHEEDAKKTSTSTSSPLRPVKLQMISMLKMLIRQNNAAISESRSYSIRCTGNQGA